MGDEQEADGKSGPRLTERGQEAKAERQRRQAEAMRANLRRRKQQARKRGEASAADAG
jgi:hypothetical protein